MKTRNASTLLLFFALLLLAPPEASSQTNYTLSFLDVKSVTFPAKYDSLTTKDVKVLYCRQKNVVYQLMYSNKADFDSTGYSKDYNAFLKGYFSSEGIKPFLHEVKDSVVGGVTGKFIHGYMNDKPAQFFTFITFLRSRSYMIQIVTFTGLNDRLKEEIDTFLATVSFKKQE